MVLRNLLFKNKKVENKIILQIVGPIKEDFTGTIDSIVETKSGHIYESEALIDYKNKEVIKVKVKRLRYARLSKRIPEKILIILLSLLFGIGFTFYIGGKIIYFIIGIILFQIIDETMITIKNKNYDKHSVEILKRK